MAKNYRYELVGLLGDPVDENPTGVTMEAAFAELGLQYRYLPLHVPAEKLADAVKALRTLGFKGSHVTVPHKVEVLKYLDRITPEAALMGAVNTLYFDEDGNLCGDNTDGRGFLVAMKEGGVTLAGANVLLLGAGGAARAIAVELANAGAARIDIVNRGKERGEELCALINEKTACKAVLHAWQGDFAIPADTTLLVQATSIGLYPDESCPALDYSTLRSDITVCDIVPNPPRTALIRRAEEAGCRTFTGLPMLVAQGAVSFKLWTGQDAPRAVMEAALAADQG
ncbi:MAG: shikimate dehydrogenase [Oscillospiraceae bacterium]|nr:shikimate dehydrogenase [Oscillospiraceae bacterium]MBQ9959295.1 shikimate dehydrogenase [Oscillospiraceae bacterium]